MTADLISAFDAFARNPSQIHRLNRLIECAVLEFVAQHGWRRSEGAPAADVGSGGVTEPAEGRGASTGSAAALKAMREGAERYKVALSRLAASDDPFVVRPRCVKHGAECLPECEYGLAPGGCARNRPIRMSVPNDPTGTDPAFAAAETGFAHKGAPIDPAFAVPQPLWGRWGGDGE